MFSGGEFMGNKFTYDIYQNYIKGTELDNPKHVEYLKNRKLSFVPEQLYEVVSEQEDKINGIPIPVDKIAGSHLTNEEGREFSLYELLVGDNPFRFSSLDIFFKILQGTSVEESIKWLDSPECANSDVEKDHGQLPNLPVARYYRDIDKYFIDEGKNRSVAAMLIKADYYRVAILREYEREESVKTTHFDNQPLQVPKRIQRSWFQKIIQKIFWINSGSV